METKPAWEILDPRVFSGVLLAVGYATGAAYKDGDRRLADQFVLLANQLNLGNPNYRPYDVAEKV